MAAGPALRARLLSSLPSPGRAPPGKSLRYGRASSTTRATEDRARARVRGSGERRKSIGDGMHPVRVEERRGAGTIGQRERACRTPTLRA